MTLIYIEIYAYITKMVGVVVLFLLSVLYQAEVVKCSAIFLKMPKSRNIKIVIFRKHFSHSLKNMV